MTIVLVTGAAGAVGRPVCRALMAEGHDVIAFDRGVCHGVTRSIQGNVADADALSKAMEGANVVVHLAAQAHDVPFRDLVEPNVMGLHAVLSEARAHRISKVILASSIQVVGWRKDTSSPAPVTETNPDNHYALTKLWAESMGAMYANQFGLQILAVRIAWMVRDLAEARRMQELGRYDIYLSARDVGRLFCRAVSSTWAGFEVVYATSRGGEKSYDAEPARRLLGYEPIDRWPEGLDFPFTAEENSG
jgi:nucleoside-diphosphate-sugar epimerase